MGRLWFAGVVVACAAAAAATAQEPLLALGEPAAWARLETSKLHGRPSRLAWSDDRSQLYLQTVEGTTAADLKYHHYIVRKGAPQLAVDSQPKWVDEYWKWKSAKAFFGDRSVTIDVDTEHRLFENLNGTAANKTAYLSDTPLTGTQLTLSREPGESQIVNRLLLKGEVIGEFVDELIVPGYTFSWSPETLRMIAFRAPRGKLTIMDFDGRTQTIPSTTDVVLPAWSDDGAAIAYIDRTSRRSLTVAVVEILQR